MAYLNTGTSVVDVKLTDKGRELLGTGNFKIAKFAFGDSEIDYEIETGSTFTSLDESFILGAIDNPADIRFKLYKSGQKPTGTPYLSVIADDIEMQVGDERTAMVETYWPPLTDVYGEEYVWTNIGPMSDDDLVLIPSTNTKSCVIIATDTTGTLKLKVEGLVSGAYTTIDIEVKNE